MLLLVIVITSALNRATLAFRLTVFAAAVVLATVLAAGVSF